MTMNITILRSITQCRVQAWYQEKKKGREGEREN